MINPDNSIDLENKEVEVYAGIKHRDEINKSGESIDIEEELEIPMQIKISGNSKQETREGSNILNFNVSQNSKVTVNEDGTLTINGTGGFAIYFEEITLNEGTTYYEKYELISGTITGSNSKPFMSFNTASNLWLSEGKFLSYTPTEDIKKTGVWVSDNVVLDNVVIRIWANTDQSDFEKYGVSPSPDYPSEVESCGDNVNLFDIDKCHLEVGALDGNGTPTDSTTRVRFSDYYFLKAGTYTISFSGLRDSVTYIYDSNKKKVNSPNWVQGTSIITLNEDGYIKCAFRNSTSTDVIVDDMKNLKLEKGSTPTPYSPYGQGCINEVICNKNLFDKNSKQLETYKTYYHMNGEQLGNSKYTYIILNNLESGKEYTYSGVNSASGVNVVVFDFYKDNTFISCKYFSDKSNKITIPDGCNKVYFSIPYADKDTVQLEEGTEATEYIEYQSQTFTIPTQQPMRSIGDVRDTFVKVDGKWFERHNVERIIFDGTTNKFVAKSGTTANNMLITNTFGSGNIILPKSNGDKVEIFNNYFNTNYSTDQIYTSGYVGSALRFSSDLSMGFGLDSEITTVDLGNAWLIEKYEAGTPVYTDYLLKTPNDIECTEEQSVILDEIENTIKTYSGVTHIYTIDNIAPILDVKYGVEEIPFGRFIIQKPENEEVKDKTSFIGYDYMQKFNKIYIDYNEYPITLGEYLKKLCSFVNIELGSNIVDLINTNYEIQGNPFTNNEDCMTVLSNIAQLCGGFAKIGRDNKLYIIALENNLVETIDGNNYFEDFNKNEEWGEVNSLILRLSQVEGENTTRQDDENINVNGLTELTIADNYFLTEQTEREKVIDELWNKIKGLKYLPFKTEYYGYPYLDVGDYISIGDNEDIYYNSYILNHSFIYNGGYKGYLDTNALTKTQTAYKNTSNIKTKFRNVEIAVDKINGQITSVIEKQTETEDKLSQTRQDIDSLTSTIISKDEIESQINELKQTIEGTTNKLTNSGGNNIFYYSKEYWETTDENSQLGIQEFSDTNVQQNTVSQLGYKVNNGNAIQKQIVKNGTYTVSFLYEKLIDLATGYILINGTRYDLDVENINEWVEKIITVEITSNTIDFEIISDTDNSFIIADLMVNAGTEKQVWSQNANETLTDTVKIGKGIQVESSSSNTYTRIDADGNRTYNKTTNERVAEMTDKGVYANELEVKGQAKINILLIQEIDNQVWLTGIGG